ncbi:HHIP-like protein 1 [Babylonia areolata]|uniref:HHIP-like protein 1 n=1 Tax=Babylonia areolata TaxID=304850 RepID=UPI003FD10BB7
MSELVSSVLLTITVLLVSNRISTADDVTSPCLCLKKEVDKLHNPVEYVVTGRNASSPRLTLVVEQRGLVRAFLAENKEREAVFLNITDRVTTSDRPGEQRGLLSLVLHPHYNHTRRGRVFVYYVTTVAGTDRVVVSEFQAYDDVVDVTSERQLLHVEQPTARANGGQLLFGDDGYLYIFTGDGAGHNYNESLEHAQDLQSFLGKALRVDVDRQGFQGAGGSARAYVYDVPSSNPFLHHQPPARPEIFALGFFNPWRCSQDRARRGGTGAIFCGDTGSDRFEEINIVSKGYNYGWNFKEGDYCYSPVVNNCSQIDKEGVPIHSYPNTGSAVVGGFVYRGVNFSTLVGDYIFGDAVSGEISLLRDDKQGGSPGQWSSRPWPVCPKSWCPCHARDPKEPFLLAFGQDPDGEMMVLMASEFSVQRPAGTLYRVLPPSGNDQKAVTCGGGGLTPTLLMLHLPPLLFLMSLFRVTLT